LGRLGRQRYDVIKRHTIWGLELLRRNPLPAQLICVVDVYDALTTTRSYRPAMMKGEALATMEDCRHWWRQDVFEAFLRAI
jgi:HD-GYP domain-containing protein (c-di-GMP phosphodiesterase class II)